MKKWKTPSNAYLRRFLSWTLAFFICAGAVVLSPLFSDAADKVDLESACNLTILSTSSTDPVFLEDIEKANVVMDLYKVADAKEIKGSDGYTFEVVDPYTGLVDVKTDTDVKLWYSLAQDAAKVVKAYYDAGTPITPSATVEAGKKAAGLEAGLYLIIARGAEETDYFDTVGNEEKDEVVTIANGYEYSYTFTPEFVALPTKTPDALTGEIDLTADSEWLYGATVNMKPMSEPRFGDLRIIKDLRTFETSEPAYFVFEVEAEKELNGEKRNVFSNVYTLKFTDAGENYLLVKDIPVGAEVTVSEVYSGASYSLTTAPTQSTVIIANDIVDVSFTNEYNENNKRGGAITNHFDPVLDENGNVVLDEKGMPMYVWSQYGDSSEEVTD
ncbi:MAG: hypothetical protein IJ796_09940 [Lachnospiraceae bacterium]|nr:hypothetical protein [Lachnospiraceae bacterium]